MRRRTFPRALVLTALLTSTAFAQEPKPEAAPVADATAAARQLDAAAGNQEVIDLLKAGMSPAVVIAKVKSSSSKFDTAPAALQSLKAAGATDEVILAIIEAASPKKEELAPTVGKRRVTDELTTKFRELQSSVVTVWSEIGHGTGFIFDGRGLVMTNQHVVGPSEYVSVQFNEKTKVPARILATDPQKDVAVLWVDLASLPGSAVAQIAKGTDEEPAVIEGERVMTIGSPLNQRKIMTTGIASKVEPHAIISDVNINHGNSGGPLFNSVGEVVGITTFGDFTKQGGPGVSGIVRIEETAAVVELAVGKMAQVEKPEARLLPVDPTDKYPLDAIKDVVEAKKFDYDPYKFVEANFEVTIITPLMRYRMATEAEREAAKTKNKRNNSKEAVQGTFSTTEQFRNWAEYVGEYKPVLLVQAQPVLGESFWGAVGRGVAANYGIRTQANLRFKTDFYKMKLFCGDKMVEPIHPAKIFFLTNESNFFVKSKDATYAGFYSYPADAITEACGTVRIELFSEKHPDKAESKTLGKKTVAKIVSDFQPYFRARQ
jgi:S1-C subfamily serine protease